MDNLKIIRKVVSRFIQAGPVVHLPQKPRVPTVAVAGKKYNLSDYIGPTGSDIEESAKQGPARLIENPHANKWRYLWVYDLDKSVVVMWRVSDGDEKFWGSANSSADVIARLEKKGQLNRISNQEFHKIEADMKRRYRETMEALEKSVAESKDELTRQVDKLVEEFFESQVAPKLERAISSVERGATPLGFEPNDRIPFSREHQMLSFVFYQTMKREMTQGAVEKYLRSKGIDVEEAGQWVDWAIQDVNEKAYRAYIPRESLTAFKYVPKETKQHKAERVSQYIRDVTGLQKGTAYAIADAFVRGRDVNRLSVPKGWPVEEGVITGPNGSMPIFALQSLQEGAAP
jgi:hypothetical protein